MADIKWIKLSINMFDDEKIKLIRTMPEGNSIALIWIQILCLAGKINDGGLVYMGQNLAYSDEMLATILDHPLNIMRVALQTLEQFGMISVANDGRLDVNNWSKHQSTDKMAQVKEQNRVRQQRYYYRNQLRSLGYEEHDIPDNLDELKELVEKPDVSLTLANATEVRSKKLEVRSKKLEVRSKKLEVRSKDIEQKTTPAVLENDFDAIWKSYPNKKGKAKAFAAYKKAIKDGVTNETIQAGVTNYALEIKNKRTAPEYIAHGSTWFGNRRWEDDYDTGRQFTNLSDLPDIPDTEELPF